MGGVQRLDSESSVCLPYIMNIMFALFQYFLLLLEHILRNINLLWQDIGTDKPRLLKQNLHGHWSPLDQNFLGHWTMSKQILKRTNMTKHPLIRSVLIFSMSIQMWCNVLNQSFCLPMSYRCNEHPNVWRTAWVSEVVEELRGEQCCPDCPALNTYFCHCCWYTACTRYLLHRLY